MPPKDNITQTGPLTGAQLQKQNNDEFSKYFGDYRTWESYRSLRKTGYNDAQISRIYRNAVFRSKYGDRPDYESWAKSMSPEQRDNILLIDVMPKQEPYVFGQDNTQESPFIPHVPTAQEMWAEHLDEEAAEQAFKDGTPVQNEAQAKKLAKKVQEEANRRYPRVTLRPSLKGSGKIGEALESVMKALDPNPVNRLTTLVEDRVVAPKRAEYVRDNLRIPQPENPFVNISEEQFVQMFDSLLSNTYRKRKGTKWLPEEKIDYHSLYEQNKKYLDSGQLWKVQANIEKHLGNIIESYQPTWSGGDDLVHSKAHVFFEQAAAGAVENAMDALLVPAGLVQGGWNALVHGDNFWEEASYLPSIAHDVAGNIAGEEALAFGDSYGSALANSGYTIGTMATDVALMAIPVTELSGKAFGAMSKMNLGKASAMFEDAARALSSAKAKQIWGTANALNFGVIEGTIDALDVRSEIIEKAKQTALTLPEEQRDEFMENAISEANAAYGRTVLEESIIVNAGTLMGLGFLGSIAPVSTVNRFVPKWQKSMGKLLNSGNKWQKAGLYAGKIADGVTQLTLGEILEELGQGMSSGVNKLRAEYNINNYAEALHYGLGADYLSDSHIGFMQGLERFTPQAWTEMDPENLAKQVIISTLLFRGAKLPGKGKTRAQINADNATKLGKLWDNIAKYSPVQTGIGQIVADAKADVYDVENSLHAGFEALLHDDNLAALMQSQAAQTEVGMLLQDALNNGDSSSYQKMSAAYQVAQAVTLANARRANTRFGKSYEQVLQNRANFDSLDDAAKEKVLNAYIEEQQSNGIKQLSSEQQIEFMKKTASNSLALLEQADQVYEKLSKNENFDGQDIRPLVYAELLNAQVPNTITENWNSLAPAIEQVFRDNKFENINPTALQYVKENYYSQSDFRNRADALHDFQKERKAEEGFTKDDVSKAFAAVNIELSKLNQETARIIRDDNSLTNWQTKLANEWTKIYTKLLKGEGAISDEQYNNLVSQYKKRVKQSLDKREKEYAERIKQSSGSVGQMASIMNQMISDDEIGKERAVQVASTQASPESIQEALKTLDAVKDLKDTIERITPADSPVREALPRLFDYIDARTSSVNSSADVLSLATYSSLNNPTLQALMAYAISEVGTQEAIPVTDAPVTKHDKDDLDKGTSTDASVEPEQEGSPLPNDETFEEKAPSTEQEVPEHQASTQVQEIEKWDNELSTIGDALNSGSLDPTTAGNQLYSLKQELENLYKKVSGDELRSRVKEDIDRATELIKIALALPSTHVETSPLKKRRVIKTSYWEGLKAFKKDIVKYFREARQAKRATTPEEFVDTFWNSSYENFDAVKEAFMELLPYDSRTEENAKALFTDYFTSNKKLKTNRKGAIDISANEIVRRILGIVSEEEAIKIVGGMSLEEYEDMLNSDQTPDGLPIDMAGYTTPEFSAKMQTRAAISTLISEKKVIIDDTGDLVDAKAKWVAHKLKNGELPKRKNAIKLSALIDELESRHGSADWAGLIQNFASYGLPRYKELVRDEYNAYLSNSGVWDRIAEWQRADEEALDEMALQSYFAEQDAFENELNAQFLEELSRPVAIQIKLGNSKRTYDYATTNLDYEPGQTFQVLTQYGPTTATVVSYNKPIYSGTLKDLSTIIVPTREQAERRLQQFNDESKKRKHKDAVQNAFTSDTSRIVDTHSEVLDVLKKDGAAQFIMRGNLHEGDELGFILGTWQSPDGVRPVVYIVTKNTYEHGSNDDSLFKGHQVIGVLDTDSATLDSKVYTEVNDIRQGLSTGDYFELRSNPLVVSNVSTSGVKVKSIIGEARDSKAVDETNLNKVLDSSNGSFGIEYDGKLAPITLISNKNGSIQSSNPNYDLKQLFDPSKSAEENAKRLIGNKADATLPENVTLMIVPTPSGDTAQLAVYAVDDTVEDFQSRLNNMLTSSPIGDAIKQNLKEKLMQLWRKSKKADVENVKFSLGTYFRLNGDGIVVTYFGGQFRFSLGKDTTPLFAIPFDMADLGLASKSAEETEKLFDTTTVVDDCWNALLSGLTNPAQKIIRAVNLDVNNIASNPDILQQQIAAGALYVPNVVTGEDSKITLQNASFTAYTEDTKPVEKVSTKSKDATTTVVSSNDNSSLVQQTESSSVISQPSAQPKSEGVSEEDVTPRSIISSRRKKKLKMSREISREPLESPNTNTSSVKSNAEISTMPYQEAIKYADITMDEATWNSLGGIEKLQYLNCK